MKTLGFLGGTTWVSTIEYYRLTNLGVNRRLGDLNSARCIVYFNFEMRSKATTFDPFQK